MNCLQCEALFVPRAKGYNAKYCTNKCRNKARKKRLVPSTVVAQRKRRYVRIKNDPLRLQLHRKQNIASRASVRQWLADYKMEHGCADCGYRLHFSALQLDHTGPKTIEIADARSSIERLSEEIKAGACIVRCANCHAVKTWERKRMEMST